MANQPIRYIKMPNGDVLSNAGPQFCTCSTASTTQNKEIKIENIDTGKIPLGYSILVRMNHAQMYDGNPTLTLKNKTGTKTILQSTPINRAPYTPATINEWPDGALLLFTLGEEYDSELTPHPVWYIVGSERIATLTLNGNQIFPDAKRNVDLASVFNDMTATMSEVETYFGLT